MAALSFCNRCDCASFGDMGATGGGGMAWLCIDMPDPGGPFMGIASAGALAAA
jgi:hypothetical protein